MSCRYLLCAGTTALAAVVSRPAVAGELPWLGDGEPVVRHEPHPYGGPGSDTEYIDPYGPPLPVWQRLADDIRLAAPATIRRITWWGFYHSDNPPATERMRVRVYDGRSAGNLPGNVLFEEEILNPARTATGRRIPVSILPREFYFEADLMTPLTLNASMPYWLPYWLEIVQLGDVDTHFRWEFALAERNAFAFINDLTWEWRLATPLGVDLAFELWQVPDPAPGLVLSVLLLVSGHRRTGKRGAY